MSTPLIGLDTDLTTDAKGVTRCTLRQDYVTAVIQAGGLPVLLPPEPKQASAWLDACDGVILTGGDDPCTESFGQPTHAKARPIEARRQAFVLALLEAMVDRPRLPVLGVCLGMQMMALHAGGQLHQYLPEVLDDASIHQGCKAHRVMVLPEAMNSVIMAEVRNRPLEVISAHQQAVEFAGNLRVVAKAEDGVIEAVDDPARRYYVGVQWHPERGGQSSLSLGLLQRFVAACRNAS